MQACHVRWIAYLAIVWQLSIHVVFHRRVPALDAEPFTCRQIEALSVTDLRESFIEQGFELFSIVVSTRVFRCGFLARTLATAQSSRLCRLPSSRSST